MRPTLAAPSRWVQGIALLLVLAGLGVSTYLTIQHYDTSLTLSCPNTGVINCEKVTTSAESTLAGVPVALLGLLFFAWLLLLMNPWAWRRPLLRWLRMLSVVGGVGFVIYLIYTEFVTLDAVCLWCSSVHAITLLLFFVVLSATVLARPADEAGTEGSDDGHAGA
jgi:uncharacterized membrane protein